MVTVANPSQRARDRGRRLRRFAQKKMIKRYVKSLLSKSKEDASDEDDEENVPMRDAAVHQIRQKSPNSKGK